MSRNDLTRNQQQWLVHIEACASSGETLKGYAERCGLSLKTLYMAKSRLKGLGILDGEASGRDVRFVRVSRAVEVCTASGCRVQFPNGVSVEVTLTPGSLEAVLRSVSAAMCSGTPWVAPAFLNSTRNSATSLRRAYQRVLRIPIFRPVCRSGSFERLLATALEVGQRLLPRIVELHRPCRGDIQLAHAATLGGHRFLNERPIRLEALRLAVHLLGLRLVDSESLRTPTSTASATARKCPTTSSGICLRKERRRDQYAVHARLYGALGK